MNMYMWVCLCAHAYIYIHTRTINNPQRVGTCTKDMDVMQSAQSLFSRDAG